MPHYVPPPCQLRSGTRRSTSADRNIDRRERRCEMPLLNRVVRHTSRPRHGIKLGCTTSDLCRWRQTLTGRTTMILTGYNLQRVAPLPHDQLNVIATITHRLGDVMCPAFNELKLAGLHHCAPRPCGPPADLAAAMRRMTLLLQQTVWPARASRLP